MVIRSPDWTDSSKAERCVFASNAPTSRMIFFQLDFQLDLFLAVSRLDRQCACFPEGTGLADPRLFPQRLQPCRAPRNDAMRCRHCGHRADNANRARIASWPYRLDKLLVWAGSQALWRCRRSVVMQLSLGRSAQTDGVNRPYPGGRSAIDLGVGVDERQVLALLLGEPGIGGAAWFCGLTHP